MSETELDECVKGIEQEYEIEARTCSSDKYSGVEYTFSVDAGYVDVRAVVETVDSWNGRLIEQMMVPEPSEPHDFVVFVADVTREQKVFA